MPTRREKLEAMADQDVSPNEAEIAARMLGRKPSGSTRADASAPDPVDASPLEQPTVPAGDPRVCHCSHPRAVHDPCSVCECEGFRGSDRVKGKRYRKRPTGPEPVWEAS